MEKIAICNKIIKAIDLLYKEDYFLFEIDVCERALSHRLAVHIENQKFADHYVDCEYNKAHSEKGHGTKVVSNLNGNYIDILITKRDGNAENDLACFEVKKWNNKKDRHKDRKNLEILTDQIHFMHKFGFYIILSKRRSDVKIELYQNGLYQEDLKTDTQRTKR